MSVEAAHHGAVREIAVAAKGQLAQQEISRGVDPVSLDEDIRRDAVAQRFRHLLAFDGPPAMGEDAPWRLEARCHQKGRPIDPVGGPNVLAYDVKNVRPER